MASHKKYNTDYFPHNNDMRNDRRCKALRRKPPFGERVI